MLRLCLNTLLFCYVKLNGTIMIRCHNKHCYDTMCNVRNAVMTEQTSVIPLASCYKRRRDATENL
jgi:hypothetical protein